MRRFPEKDDIEDDLASAPAGAFLLECKTFVHNTKYLPIHYG